MEVCMFQFLKFNDLKDDEIKLVLKSQDLPDYEKGISINRVEISCRRTADSDRGENRPDIPAISQAGIVYFSFDRKGQKDAKDNASQLYVFNRNKGKSTREASKILHNTAEIPWKRKIKDDRAIRKRENSRILVCYKGKRLLSDSRVIFKRKCNTVR